MFVSVFLLSESGDGILLATGCVAEMRCQSWAEHGEPSLSVGAVHGLFVGAAGRELPLPSRLIPLAEAQGAAGSGTDAHLGSFNACTARLTSVPAARLHSLSASLREFRFVSAAPA